MRNGQSAGGGLSGLLAFLGVLFLTKTDGYKSSVSGLGAAGASFFTLGVLTLGAAFLFSNPITFGVLACVGGASMLTGVALGASNAAQQPSKSSVSRENGDIPVDPIQRPESTNGGAGPRASAAFASNPPPFNPESSEYTGSAEAFQAEHATPSAYYQPPGGR